jgi:hypothetical protein
VEVHVIVGFGNVRSDIFREIDFVSVGVEVGAASQASDRVVITCAVADTR